MVENEILSRWREYFEDLLNPVKASTCDTHEMTHTRENAAGEDEIRPEMLKSAGWRRNSPVHASVSSCSWAKLPEIGKQV